MLIGYVRVVNVQLHTLITSGVYNGDRSLYHLEPVGSFCKIRPASTSPQATINICIYASEASLLWWSEKPPLMSLYIFRSHICSPEPKCLGLIGRAWKWLNHIKRPMFEVQICYITYFPVWDSLNYVALSDHFSHRKRSRSKVKTQERKPEQTTPGSDPEEGGAAKPEVSN